MAPSDVIALGALCLSGLALCVSVFISIVGFVFNYYTNKQNIKARRADIIAEKSNEAFRVLVEKLNIYILVRSVDKQGEKLGVVRTVPDNSREDLFDIYCKYGLYFPSTIRQDILSLADSFRSKSEIKDYDIAIHKAQRLIDRVQKHLGIETEEREH